MATATLVPASWRNDQYGVSWSNTSNVLTLNNVVATSSSSTNIGPGINMDTGPIDGLQGTIDAVRFTVRIRASGAGSTLDRGWIQRPDNANIGSHTFTQAISTTLTTYNLDATGAQLEAGHALPLPRLEDISNSNLIARIHIINSPSRSIELDYVELVITYTEEPPPGNGLLLAMDRNRLVRV